jgi:UDP-N-acetylmuramate--alanine ligase
MEGVTSEMLLSRMTLSKKQVMEKEVMLDWMAKNKPELVVMAGAGDIDALVLTVKELLK